MKFYVIVAVLIFASAGAISYWYDHLKLRRTTRRKREQLLAQLTSLPPVKADFTTPEGAVLYLEDCLRQKNIEAAVACRDFATEARLWLGERGHLSSEQKAAMTPETVRAMEKSFRDILSKGLPNDWIFGKSYFLQNEPFADAIVAVKKYTQVPEGGLFFRRILVTKTGNDWRIVKTLPSKLDDEV